MPSILELYAVSNPVSLGNPDLKPETIDTYELIFTYTPSRDWTSTINLFSYNLRDYVTYVSAGGIGRVAAGSEQSGYGISLESSYNLTSQLRITGNYSYVRAEDDKTGRKAADVPSHTAYGRVEWRPESAWYLGFQARATGSQPREQGDARKDLAGYVRADIIARTTAFMENVEVSVSVRNLFDKKTFSPQPGPNPARPGDLELPGRGYYLEAQYKF